MRNSLFAKKHFIIGLLIFLLLQVFYYLFLMVYYDRMPFETHLYSTGFHYKDFQWDNTKPFNIITGLSPWDGQWYLRIADAGYTTKAEVDTYKGANFPDQYAYAFLPLYPYLVSTVNVAINNTLVSAFVVSNVLIIAIFFSVYYVVSKLYSSEVAMRTNFLMLFFPYALYFRNYYAESLFVLLLIWFCYTLIKRQWLLVGILLSMMYLTKANGFFLLLPLVIVLYRDYKKKKISLKKAFAVIVLPMISYVYLFVFSKINMHDWMFWVTAHDYWGKKPFIIDNISKNLETIYNFNSLPDHKYQPSKSEVVAFFVGLFFLIKSKKVLRYELWYICLGLFLLPLIIKNFTSFTRYEIVIFPLYIYLATKLKGKWYIGAMIFFIFTLLMTSVLFINWHWVE